MTKEKKLEYAQYLKNIKKARSLINLALNPRSVYNTQDSTKTKHTKTLLKELQELI